jgi:hypothetical protein
MISLCVPTRGRPARFRDMLGSARRTTRTPFEVCAWMDDDDDTASLYPKDSYVHYGSGPRPYIDGSLCTSALWNRAWEMASGDIAMMASDDILFHTPGWDVAVEEAFAEVPDRILMVYADDGTKRKAPVSPFIHRRWIEAVGFTPPDFQGWYADNWVWTLAAELGRVRFLKLIRIAHFQKKGSDATYRDGEKARDAVGGWRGMRDRFFSPEMMQRRDAQLETLAGLMTSGALPLPDPVPDWLTESVTLSLAAR